MFMTADIWGNGVGRVIGHGSNGVMKNRGCQSNVRNVRTQDQCSHSRLDEDQ